MYHSKVNVGKSSFSKGIPFYGKSYKYVYFARKEIPNVQTPYRVLLQETMHSKRKIFLSSNFFPRKLTHTPNSNESSNVRTAHMSQNCRQRSFICLKDILSA